jgi:uncharacterized membrane protein YgcG
VTIVRNRRVGRAGPLAAAVALVLVASPAAAEDPVTLDPGPITDRAGVLDAAGRADAVAAIGKLKSEDGVDLFVVFVDSFDGIPSQQWTDQTAQRNGLGLNDALLAVAVGDRQYAWSVDESFPLSDDELADINADLVEPRLADEDWSGAAVAEALEQVAILDRAVTDLGPALAEARAGLRARVVSLQQDLADVERLGVAGDPAVATAAAGARAAVVSVDGHYDDVALDPHAAGANLARAEEALDAALGPAREQQARVDKARATLPAELGAAESRIRSIDDFITTRRGAVGPSARTDLAEARRLVQEARRVAETDPVAALTTAKEAGDLAARASTQAQADVRDYQRAPYGGTAGSGGGGFNLGALVMSGILLDQMTRGGRGGGYRGGSRSGSGWSGGARPGGFGGSGRRRGGGGRF